MDPKKTKFASPERSPQEEIVSSRDMVENDKIFLKALNAFPDVVMVLNSNRQIIYCNTKVLAMLGLSCMEDALGKRPGEAFRCIHSGLEAAGCGTSEFCRECGAVKSILDAQSGQVNSQECRMTINTKEGDFALDLRVWTVPISIKENEFVVLTIRDIVDEKRREALEHTFFHDILNDLGILMGYSQNVRDGLLIEGENPGEKMNVYAMRLVDAINAQRDLLSAERGEYQLQSDTFFAAEFLNEIIESAKNSTWVRGREIVLDCKDPGQEIKADRLVLSRVLTNLIKNAVEATEPGGTVLVGYQKGRRHCFSVHNDSVMQESVKLQVFQRSFSTKGKGRGIGTYSVKLFTEKYLKGKITFSSKEGEGTEFTLSLP